MQMVEMNDVIKWVLEVKERYGREKNQGIEQWNLQKAALAHAAEDACDRIVVELRWRQQALAGLREASLRQHARRQKSARKATPPQADAPRAQNPGLGSNGKSRRAHVAPSHVSTAPDLVDSGEARR